MTFLFKLCLAMVTLLDETSSNRKYLCIRLNDQDNKETKLHVRKSMTYYSKSNRPRCPPHLTF